ncbi:PREDICTED: zymogen granule protein 16 homolog B [Hipposideros armiger]|uniref:Zymogen granule protein 16 homolog B n=1 Tax=Hipposideros armiger TaxID=186990 RepID=A0A8B7QPK4_HIPAR|nr:PREDICTED: zymogen granule protein 16 homolog B [Hipposideros armiger]
MLLWLTLTFLWSTICWAHEMFGNGGGTYFSTPAGNENDITGIRVSISPIGIFKSIQVKYGSSWSETYGVSGGQAQEFNLWPEEHIIGLYGMYKIYLRYLAIYTDIGRWAAFGKEDGRSFLVYSEQPGQVLKEVFGQYKLLGISGLGFKWGDPKIDLESAQAQNSTGK